MKAEKYSQMNSEVGRDGLPAAPKAVLWAGRHSELHACHYLAEGGHFGQPHPRERVSRRRRAFALRLKPNKQPRL